MKNKDFKKGILETIESRQIKPKSKWCFLLKDYIVWVFGIISILVGGVATSVTIFTFINSDWASYRYLSDSFPEYIIKTAPFLWIVFLILFIFVADYNFTHTKKGYKYSVSKVVGLSVLVSIILGSLFYQVGFAHVADYELGRYLSGYQMMTEKRQRLWNQPDKGLLAGTLISSEKSDTLVLKDFEDKEWNVAVDKLMPIHFIILDNVETVAFVGYIKGDNVFEACDVKPWQIKGESQYLREKIHNQMMESGIESPLPLGNMDDLRMKFREENLNERNIFKLRNNMCERGASTSTFTNPR